MNEPLYNQLTENDPLTSPSKKEVEGIILAGVHQWNNDSFCGRLPRSLVPVGIWPLVSYVMRWMKEGGIDRITMCANSSSRLVRKCLGDGSRSQTTLCYYEDWTPRGPAGCVRDAGVISEAERFVVSDATIIPLLDLKELLRFHRETQSVMTVVFHHDLKQDSEAETFLTPSGIYVIDKRAFSYIRNTGYQDIKEVLIPVLHDAGEKVSAFVHDRPCFSIKDIPSYLLANEWALNQLMTCSALMPEFRRDRETLIHKEASVSPTASFAGPVLLGPGSVVKDGATVIGPTVIGTGSVISEGTVLCRSIVWENCSVGKSCNIDQTLLGMGKTIPDKSYLAGARLV
jgi:NDP-sugar pyrophosphorylase family protein